MKSFSSLNEIEHSPIFSPGSKSSSWIIKLNPRFEVNGEEHIGLHLILVNTADECKALQAKYWLAITDTKTKHRYVQRSSSLNGLPFVCSRETIGEGSNTVAPRKDVLNRKFLANNDCLVIFVRIDILGKAEDYESSLVVKSLPLHLCDELKSMHLNHVSHTSKCDMKKCKRRICSEYRFLLHHVKTCHKQRVLDCVECDLLCEMLELHNEDCRDVYCKHPGCKYNEAFYEIYSNDLKQHKQTVENCATGLEVTLRTSTENNCRKTAEQPRSTSVVTSDNYLEYSADDTEENSNSNDSDSN